MRRLEFRGRSYFDTAKGKEAPTSTILSEGRQEDYVRDGKKRAPLEGHNRGRNVAQ